MNDKEKKIFKVFFIFVFIYFTMNFCLNNELFSKTNHHDHHKHKEKSNESNICRGYLTDKDFLEHMIPHHQVAVDVSYMLQKTSKIPIMQKVLRELIFVQTEEIIIMKEMLEKLPYKVSGKLFFTYEYIPDKSDYILPNKLSLTDTYCDPHFFDPDAHMKHMSHMKLDEIAYIEHMIPHHQVAVDMSKVLLKNTKNDFMIYLAYRIIRNQQHEILMLNDLLDNLKNKNKYKFESNLLL